VRYDGQGGVTFGTVAATRRHASGTVASLACASSRIRLAPWDGEVGRSQRRPEPDESKGAA